MFHVKRLDSLSKRFYHAYDAVWRRINPMGYAATPRLCAGRDDSARRNLVGSVRPPYEPCPEAVEYCKTHPTADLSDKELEDIWLKGNTCCILSREFDPNDMFDTVTVSIWGEQKKPIQMLASRFKELGYGSCRELE